MSPPHDITRTLPLLRAKRRADGEDAAVLSLLEELGVSFAPTPMAHPAGAPTQLYDPAVLTTRARARERRARTDGESFGRHEVLGELGLGGMGRVVQARDPELRRAVAIKVLANPRSVTDAQLSRFVAEAQITSQLEHPNIVPVHDMGCAADGQIYFVMKKVEGRSLREVLASLRQGHAEDVAHWSRRRLLSLFVQVCHAVAYAHDRGVLHRDLKPENIMVGRFGEVLVMDWGVARMMGDRTEVGGSDGVIERITLAPTMDGIAVGTPGYMSPEQAEGDLPALDARTDVWSLGAILYELLTLQRAFWGSGLYAIVFAARQSTPTDPRERAPDRGIPDEIAAVALRALAAQPSDRFPGAAELGAAVEAFLDGSARREAAAGHVQAARESWERHAALDRERDALLREERALADAVPAWASLPEKSSLLATRRRLREVETDRARTFGDVLAGCEQALSQDPENAAARDFLADVFHDRFLAAEAAKNEPERQHLLERVRRYDDSGRYRDSLDGTGRLTLASAPSGAEVFAQLLDQEGLLWEAGPALALGRTPLVDVPLPMGSYVVTLRAPTRIDTRVPVWMPRCGRWECPPVALLRAEEIGDGFVFVPAGPCVLGDPDVADAWPRTVAFVDAFFASALPVTLRDYCHFLDALERRDPRQARARAPRQEQGIKEGQGYFTPPAAGEAWRVPEVDDDGDRWDPDWPVFGVSWHDAVAFCRWRGEAEGRGSEAYRLPTELEWEKLARGVDGRAFPWGDTLDPALCKMRLSRAGRSQPEPVGAFPTDRSVYGAQDLAGSMREWCGDATLQGDPEQRPVRGGSWRSTEGPCRAAYRFGFVAWQVYATIGFRLVRSEALRSPGPR